MHGRVIDPVAPGSREWLGYMSASKIASVVGLSPWQSRFSLWQEMSGQLEPEPMTTDQARGHYLEPAVCAWFADQHPEFEVLPGYTWTRDDYRWMLASPDRLVYLPDGDVPAAVILNEDDTPPPPPALLEVKTSATDDEWGRPGTDEIPAYYRPQVVWQMAVTGAERVFVAVLTSRLEFREYVVEYDPDDAEWLIDQADEFMSSLVFGEEPDLDEHKATYEAVRRLHPEIDGEDIEIPPALAAEYVGAVTAKKAAEKRHQGATTAVADAMGTAKRAVCAGHTIATRQAKGKAAPYVVAGRKLPTPDQLITEGAEAA
ncbi:YqaJ viral recombinase family nuclease [Nocardiopsis protaetiae]|uniref:YqaJ viral recombinase family nuclease n=1 Tax=Nocardiopsis protaetiae TaxID=3382270 RepID=UPI00387AE9EC